MNRPSVVDVAELVLSLLAQPQATTDSGLNMSDRLPDALKQLREAIATERDTATSYPLKADLLRVVKLAEAYAGRLPADEAEGERTWLDGVRKRIEQNRGLQLAVEVDRWRRRCRRAEDALNRIGDIAGNVFLGGEEDGD